MVVSVIITIYNREKYLGDCVCSLFEQTLNDIEFIFIDDASTDKSLLILDDMVEKYPSRKPFVKIIRMENNAGRAAARQTGINNATGEYIIHVDSDDWVDKDMMELLYKKAKEADADIVGCNITHEYANYKQVFSQCYSDDMDKNVKRLLNGKIFPSLCTSMTRRSLIKDYNVQFPQGIDTGEDLDSGSFKHTEKSIKSVIEVARRIEALLNETGNYEKFKDEIQFRKFSMKCALIEKFDNEEYNKAWLNLFPETHKYIWSYKQFSWKRRIELWLAAHNCFKIAELFQMILEVQHKLRHL